MSMQLNLQDESRPLFVITEMKVHSGSNRQYIVQVNKLEDALLIAELFGLKNYLIEPVQLDYISDVVHIEEITLHPVVAD